MKFFILLSFALLVLVGAGCAKSDKPITENPSSSRAPTTQLPAAPANVASPRNQTFNAVIGGFAFNPPSLRIKAGDTVIWTNQDAAPHSVTADDISQVDLSSPLLPKGQNYSFTFKKPGIFKYHCSPHPGMKGVIIVE